MNLTLYRIHNVIFSDLYRLLQENIINKYFILNLLKEKNKPIYLNKVDNGI